MLRYTVILLVPLLFTACAFGVPPLRADLGHSWRSDGAVRRVAVGASLGSFVPLKDDLPVDVGGGLVFDTAPSSDPAMTSATVTTRGTYVDGQVAAWHNGFARVLAGVRYELYPSGAIEQAFKVRLDAEILTHVAASFSEDEGTKWMMGGALGNVGLGVYAEAGPTWSPDDTRGWTATLGVTGRLPGWGFLAFGIPTSNGSSSSGGDSHHHFIGPLSDD